MASTQMFINNSLVVNQNANIYGSYYNQGNLNQYDYTFTINISSIVGGDITTLFSNASFKQNANPDLYDINITLNSAYSFANWNTKFNNQACTQVLMGNSNIAFGTLKPNNFQTIGERMLEVVAHKIFGHGQARAAIANDHEFFNHDNQIWNQLSNTLLLNQYRNDIFNQYVGTGRYNVLSNYEAGSNAGTNTEDGVNNYNDVDTWVNFNFNGLTFEYPLYLAGTIITDPSLSPAENALLANGPNVGGTLLNNGVYNIPILVRFHQ